MDRFQRPDGIEVVPQARVIHFPQRDPRPDARMFLAVDTQRPAFGDQETLSTRRRCLCWPSRGSWPASSATR